MKLGIMQPYFFPYIGYFSLIKNTDRFVFFDTPQYVTRSWMNRNRILNANGEVAYITVPLHKAPQDTAIKDMRIDNSQAWPSSMTARFVHYKKYAPYYRQVTEFFREALLQPFSSLAELNIETTKVVCRRLGIETQFDTFSEMDLKIGPVAAPDEWALNITKELGYGTYVNPPGGKSFFDGEKYRASGIELQFLQAELRPYEQCIGRFEPGLSILDVMMFNSVEAIRDMLGEFQLL